MLLTSAQVSFAISSVIIFFFTSALFLSGYVLQQQTVRDLRAAIKPQLVRLPSGPDFFPPPRVREDGYLVDTVVIEAEKVKERTEGKDGGEEDMIGATRWQKAARRKMKAEKVEAAKGQKPMLDQGVEDLDAPEGGDATEQKKKGEKLLSRAARRKRIKEQILADGNGESFKGYRRRMW